MTLVFLHGAGSTSEVFAAQVNAFEGALAPNLPGHLCEGEPASIAEFASFVASFVRDQGLSDVVLCGHSMGGAVALQSALDRTPGVRAAVLLGSGARLRVAPAFIDGLAADFAGTARLIARNFFAEPTPERVEWAARLMERVGRPQTIRDFRACDAFDALERLGEIDVPLLALTGESDKMTPPKFAGALADRVPGGEARIVPGAGHLVMVERPEETNAAIRAFLSGVL